MPFFTITNIEKDPEYFKDEFLNNYVNRVLAFAKREMTVERVVQFIIKAASVIARTSERPEESQMDTESSASVRFEIAFYKSNSSNM